LEFPPPGAGLDTITGKLPATLISLARICTVSTVALTKVVRRLLPLIFTDAPLTKLVPFTVRVNPFPPLITLGEERPAIVGTGLGAMTVKLIAGEVPPPGVGVNTEIEYVPATARSPAVI
jgi:hypothetical protein